MYKILIVEDHDEQRKLLCDFIASLGMEYLAYSASNGEEALILLQDNKIDLFFLDLGLPDIFGLELAERIRTIPGYELTWIVFLTSFTEYIFDAFKRIHCYDYLMKPYELETVKELTLRLTGRQNLALQEQIAFISFQMKGFILKVNIEDILFFEIYNKNCTIHTRLQKYIIKKTTLKHMMDMLPPNSFIQSHRSYIVHIPYIEKISKVQNSHEITFFDYPERALLGESFKEAFINKLGVRSGE